MNEPSIPVPVFAWRTQPQIRYGMMRVMDRRKNHDKHSARSA